jgi:lipopolysaccharide transport system ATP-binding protein
MNLRLAFAVAAHLEAEILIVDEVLAVGDIAFQRKCLEKMGEVASSGRTILFVSHNMPAIQSICSRAVVLSQGEAVYAGPVDEAISRYLASVGRLQRYPIAQRSDRRGGESFRFQQVDFLDPDTERPLAALISGQPILIRIGFENASDRVLTGVGIGVGFSTMAGGHLFACRSDAVGIAHDVPPGSWYADCLIPRWMLKAGRYNFYLYAEGRRIRLDEIHEAGTVDVENGDYYGSGKLPGGQLPGVLVNFEWRSQLGRQGRPDGPD